MEPKEKSYRRLESNPFRKVESVDHINLKKKFKESSMEVNKNHNKKYHSDQLCFLQIIEAPKNKDPDNVDLDDDFYN